VADRSTVYEVARRSGVSTVTVSRVMAHGKGFSEATRERVRATRPNWAGFRAGPPGAWPPSGPGSSVCCSPISGSPAKTEEESPLYVDQVIRGAERAATSVGDAIMIAATRIASGRDLAFSIAGKTDGLVAMARSLPEEDIAVLSRSVPVVVLADHNAGAGPDFVGVDNRSGSRAITSHLIQVHGHTDLAFLAGPPDSPDSVERFAGFCEALRQADLPAPDEPTATGGFTEAGGRQAVAAMLARGRAPRAIVCGNDEMAIGALTALRAGRLRVPADIAVSGADASHPNEGLSQCHGCATEDVGPRTRRSSRWTSRRSRPAPASRPCAPITPACTARTASSTRSTPPPARSGTATSCSTSR
jgi:LacI family transcriptional regulator